MGKIENTIEKSEHVSEYVFLERGVTIISYRFFSLLDRREFSHGHLDIILVESGEELIFQVNPRINGAIKKTPEPVKGYPFEGVDELLAMIASLSIILQFETGK